MDDNTTKNVLETALDDVLPKMAQPTEIIGHQPIASPTTAHFAIPDNMRHLDLTDAIDKLATKLQPWRRAGTAKLQDLASLIAWANRHKGETSALFADISSDPSLTCIADYMGAGAPVMDHETRDPKASHCRHRALYTFPMSKEWKLWTGINNKALDKAEFGEFIETNAKDLLDPTPNLLNGHIGAANVEPWEVRMIEVARQLNGRFGQYQTLVQLSRSFQVHEVSNLTATLNRDTGETSIQFINEHREPDGQPLKIPNLFMIAIPIFDRGAAYRIPVRFRYRKAGSEVKFILSLHNADIALEDAVEEALHEATEATGLPLFRGEPERA
ncbi:YfdQ family protein [Cereibacter azotoformans]|uniref:DUF2303 family protein n=1 Tax=Cereibacter azotoformans TaxID=43057 RepID=UPI001EEB61D7|nr:DUF2303 family protein [Cereibacter azotoformans]ULB10707.1 YfdQ family protein [Cereibacter azotoformans]